MAKPLKAAATVRYIRDMKKTSWSLRLLLSIGFLVFGAYLAFDVLDLDGSNLPSDISSNTIASLESTQTDAERIFRLHYSTLVTSTQYCFLLIAQSAPDSQPSVSYSLTRVLAGRHPRMFARMHVRRETASSSSSTADPA